ncbi:uncharacterized protein CDAR_419041 [Caerostris darwini]|uniref:Uncharacterized protein n=1 Tax=Caerostris darwini TaxID=1538125 RepID=A0AAV4MVB0_9ARAC|nr:uncharacterized protein CDAR_419041 [Caerostris darwini]
MADVFLTEDYEDCVDESNEIESLEIETETDLISDSQNLLNSDSDDLNEPVTDNSDMTLKQGVSEPELFAAEDMLVNPDDLLPPVLKLQKYANSDIVFNR